MYALTGCHTIARKREKEATKFCWRSESLLSYVSALMWVTADRSRDHVQGHWGERALLARNAYFMIFRSFSSQFIKFLILFNQFKVETPYLQSWKLFKYQNSAIKIASVKICPVIQITARSLVPRRSQPWWIAICDKVKFMKLVFPFLKLNIVYEQFKWKVLLLVSLVIRATCSSVDLVFDCTV